MKTFKRLFEKGYNHYTDNSTEELDELQLSNPNIITECAHINDWLRVNHGIWVNVYLPTFFDVSNFNVSIQALKKDFKGNLNCISSQDITPKSLQRFNSDLPQKAYLAAFDYIVNNVI